MPLVKDGKIVADAFVHVADDAEIPADGAVLIPAARFLENPDALLQRNGQTGVIWPNNRDVDDLVPYLDRLAVVALVFPTFRDGRAYSQARLLRERYGYRGELRATGQVLRDQFVFMLRAGFDAFEVKKDSDAEAFAARRSATRCSISRPATAASPRCTGGCSCAIRRAPAMSNARPPDRCRSEPASTCRGADELDRALRDASPARDHCRGAGDRRPRPAGAGVVVRHRVGSLAQGHGRCRSGDSGGVSRYRLAVRGNAGLSRHADRDAGPERRAFDQAVRRGARRARIRSAICGFPIRMPAAGFARSSRWRAR